MHIKYVSVDDLYKEPHAFSESFVLDYAERLADSQKEFVVSFFDGVKSRTGQSMLPKLVFCEDKYQRVVIDTLFDIKRIKAFHHIEVPNDIKMTAYTAFWWIQRKPLVIPNTYHFFLDFPKNSQDEQHYDELELWMTNINELFCAHYIMSEIFDLDNKNNDCPCTEISEKRYAEYNTVFDYLYYYLCYRLNSPKSIELFIMGLLMHPIWKVRDGLGMILPPKSEPSNP